MADPAPIPRAMDNDDLAYLSATDLLVAYRRKQLSPLDVTRATLDRIDRLNPKLNAFVLVDHASALRDARLSQDRWQRGAPIGPLDGVPVSIKDLLLTRGWPTLRGSKTVDAAQGWEVDAPSTARLREAGAVFTDLRGEPVGLATTSVLATVPALYGPIKDAISF